MKIRDIDETPIGDLKRWVDKNTHKSMYDRAADKMYQILKRKEEENGGQWRHTLGYYAQQIGRSFRNVDYRNLYDVFLAKYGDEFKTLKELKIVKPDPKDTMGIKRNEMPQVATKDYPEFMDYLKDNGAEFKKETVPAKSLKAVQGEFSDQGVEKALRKRKLKKASIVSSDNYIIDGHHRWVAALNTGQDVDIIRVNMPAKELLKLVKDFSKTTYKDIYTEGYKLQLERGSDMDVLHITDTKTGKRTEVRGKTGYEIKHDPEDRLHKLLDKIGKAANISELLNGEPVGINPNHPDGKNAKRDTDKAFDENAPGSIAAKINWGGKNKQTKVKQTQNWFQRAKKAVFGEDDEKPHLYLDMDGVQADFFNSWAKWYSEKTGKQISNYKDIGDAEAQLASIMELTNQGPEFVEQFFANLPPLQGFESVLSWIQQNNIPYSILSAPLRGNNEASIKGKKAWLARHNPGAQQEIFTGRKESYAVNKQTKQPNVLIDDHGKYIQRWQGRGGIAIKHTDRNPQATIQALEKIYNNLEEHGFVPMYSTMKAYGMKRKTTKGQKHFVTDDVNERKLTKGEEKKKEKFVKGMKKNKDDFKKRYGKDAEAVMYATATKMAKNEDKNFGIPDGATLAQLDSIAKNAKSEKKRKRAHWLRNMRRGQNKK